MVLRCDHLPEGKTWSQAADKERRVQRWQREAENRDCRAALQEGELEKCRRCGRIGLGKEERDRQ